MTSGRGTRKRKVPYKTLGQICEIAPGRNYFYTGGRIPTPTLMNLLSDAFPIPIGMGNTPKRYHAQGRDGLDPAKYSSGKVVEVKRMG